MFVYELNRPIFLLPVFHPARQLLESFIQCRMECVGRELDFGGSEDRGVDQEWYSSVDNRMWRFSGFAYTFLSFDLVLDGWLEDLPQLTPDENRFLEKLPYLRALLRECEEACIQDSNSAVVTMIHKVDVLLDRWHAYIHARMQKIGTRRVN